MRTLTLAAVAVAALGSSAFAIDIPVTSGSFEASPPADNAFGLISGWNNVSTSDIPVPGDGRHTGVFTSYAGFSPTDGNRMAFLSNQGTGQVLMRSVMPTQVFRMYYVQFDYLYLTTAPTTTALADRDTFRVNFLFYDQNMNFLAVQGANLDTGTLSATGTNPGLPFDGNVNVGNLPDQSSSDLQTSFAFMNLDPSFVDPSVYFVQFEFVLFKGSTPGVSGVLIDNVVINPEPGTMALFGLGAAGLGAFVWRRRKSKKPAA